MKSRITRIKERSARTSRKIDTATSLAREWEALTEDPDFKDNDGQALFSLRILRGEDKFGEVWEEENAFELLSDKQAGEYAIFDVEEEKILMRARILEGGMRQSGLMPRGLTDPHHIASREMARFGDAYERQNVLFHSQLQREIDAHSSTRAQLDKALELNRDLVIKLAEKEGGIESEIPDLARMIIDAMTGKVTRDKVQEISNKVLARVPDETIRAQLAAAIVQETESTLRNQKEEKEDE